MNTRISSTSFIETKPHYSILDGLRGIAAITVVCFHIFEAFATSHVDQRINHGYLAVDFFFMLSGFVIGYAYDDRWGKMKTANFILRRIIRLQPMVVFGAILGAVLFYLPDYWDVKSISILALLGATVLNMFLIPATPEIEVRGLGEMFPLNGPSWSLFFEYIGYILYAFFIRKFSNKVLTLLTIAAACGLAGQAIFGANGDICSGYSLTGTEFLIGIFRLLFTFSAGLLMFRLFKPINIKGSFWICGILLIILLAMPRIGGEEHKWMNGIYDTLCCLVFFPIVLYLGASGKSTDTFTTKFCNLLGKISYPLYIVHYPFIYLYFAWVKNENLTFEQSLPGATSVVIGSIILAYLSLKIYDMPIRKYLSKQFLKKNT